MNKEEFEKVNVFGKGNPNVNFAQYFTGNSYLNPLTEAGKCPVFLANVTFEPGCRNNWHIHHSKSGGGQILICTAGEGWYQEEGKEAQSLKPGDVVTIPANVKHWHGAKKNSWFSHIAVEVPGEDTSNEWCEPVSDEEYDNVEDIIEKLANYEHDRWARWQKHVFSKCFQNEDGSMTIPKEFVDRWDRQINTSYFDLSDEEQLSDKKEAIKILEIIKEEGINE